MAIRVDPKDYAEGTLGALAPDLTNPADPRNNPFNADKTLAFYEVEMNIAEDGTNAPLAKPDYIADPGSVPSAFSMGISEPPEFVAPEVKKGVVNDLFPNITEPVIGGAPKPRTSAIDRDYSKTIGALPTLVLNPIDETLTAEDGPGYSELQFKTTKPATPNPTQYTWNDPANYGLTQKNVEWLTFLLYDKFFSNTGYQLEGTQLLNPDSSLYERLTNAKLLGSNSVWKNMTEDFLKEIVFAPDLPSGDSQLNWANIVNYVNGYMARDYLNTQNAIRISDEGRIALNSNVSTDDVGWADPTTPLDYLKTLIEQKTSVLLYKDKISALDSYYVRKVLSAFFTKKFNQDSSDSETMAEVLCRDLLQIGIATALKALESEQAQSDDVIKTAIAQEINNYFNGTFNPGTVAESIGSALKYKNEGAAKSVADVAAAIFDEFDRQGLFKDADRDTILNSIHEELPVLCRSVIGDLVVNEARRYKLQCQISQIDQYTQVASSGLEIDDNLEIADILLSADSDPITGSDIEILQNALKYIKGQLILLKNENHLPAKLTVDDIIDGKPIPEENSIFTSITDYLNGDTFNLRQYVDNRLRASLTQAVHQTLVNEMQDSKIRNTIKRIFPKQNETNEIVQDQLVQGQREKLRYALLGNFLPDLETYIVNSLLDKTARLSTEDDSVAAQDLIDALISGSLTNLSIKNWINAGVNFFLNGGADEATQTALAEKYAFIRDKTLCLNALRVIQEILKLDENYREDESPLILTVEGQISEETIVLAYKDKIEAQLQNIKAILLGEETLVGNSIKVLAEDANAKKFLEYVYAKVLKDHYEPIIYNDFVKYTKQLAGWFGGNSNSQSASSINDLLIAKIEELRMSYGTYYDAIQSFPSYGEYYAFDDTYTRHPKLDNQYDLFSSFFNANRSALNISTLLTDYLTIYNQYGKKCYSSYGKYDISDYSVELTKLLEKYEELAGSSDIFSEATLQGMRDELIALKRELEAIDLYVECIKANEFRKELQDYLLEEIVGGWRSDTVKRQVLVNAVYRIAIDHGIMRVKEDGTYGSGTVDTSNISPNGEKEYDEDAGGYLYVKEMVAYVANKYNPEQDINIPVAEILKAIDTYKTSDLYSQEELLSQFKRLITANEHIPYTMGTSLFSVLTKYISSNSIDFSLLTLLSQVYPTIKSDQYVPSGINDLAVEVISDATTDIKSKMINVKNLANNLNAMFSTFLTSATKSAINLDRYDTLKTALSGLGNA
ncbi:MAG: hypothetical protein LBS71_00070, partial [Puniceicoccales bacterium]|nr:hypothetical protein [Puniceicoccales bacterium]